MAKGKTAYGYDYRRLTNIVDGVGTTAYGYDVVVCWFRDRPWASDMAMIGLIVMLLSFVVLAGTTAVQMSTDRKLKRATQLADETGSGAVPRCRRYRRIVAGLSIAYFGFVLLLMRGEVAFLVRMLASFVAVPCIILSLADIRDARATLKALRERGGGT